MNLLIGIDLGGTSIKSALIDPDGNIITHKERPSDAKISREAIVKNIGESITELAVTVDNAKDKIIGIGIGTPGVIENNFILGGAENLAGWEGFNLADALKSFSDLPIFVENDANLMGLGEATFGIAKGMSDVIFLTVGTGIGGAMLLNGKLYSGYRNRGSEIGHFPINSEGRMCNCGMRGCLEAHASTTALITDYLEIAQKNGVNTIPEQVNGKYITEKYFSGESTAVEAFNLHFEYLSKGISGLINIFSPQLIVIGGGISEAGSFYIEEIAKRVDRYALKSCSELTRIERATLGNKAGCLGAAALVLSNL